MNVTISPTLRAWLVDTGERVGSSFLEAAISAAVAGALASGMNASAMHVLLIAGLTAAASTLKAIIAAKFNGTVSPASLAPQQQPGQAISDAPGPVSAGDAAARLAYADANEQRRRMSQKPVLVRTIILPERKIAGKSLGRHVHHDERSRNYAVTPQAAPLVSVRHKRRARVFDQDIPKPLGSCTGNACAGALSTAPFGHRFTETRAIAIYKAATRIDNVPGSYPPTDTGSDGLSVAKVAKNNGWCSSYSHCFSLDAVLTALQTGPVMLGVSWRSGFDTPTADGQMRYTGAVRGGHEICADEIDVENKRVWITNSWGTSWALQGRAWWSFDDLAKILADNGDATVLNP